VLNVLLLTPLPGTRLWDQMRAEDRFALDDFPEDWGYYTLTFPVVRYKHLSTQAIIDEVIACGRRFYSVPRILRRMGRNLGQRRKPLFSLAANLSYRRNLGADGKAYADFLRSFPEGRRSSHVSPRSTACHSGRENG
jgi:hypothetical protein